MKFFDFVEATDPWFLNIASRSNLVEMDAYDYVEALWASNQPYLDRSLPRRATTQFQQAFWELYLADILRASDLDLCKRSGRRYARKGPDFQLGNVTAWVEAVAVTAGTGTDAVVDSQPGIVSSVPDDPIKLRLLNGIYEKLRKYRRYRESNIVLDSEPYVVAVNAALVPSASLELDVPRIVRVVFPLGFPTVTLDKGSGHVVDQSYSYVCEARKASGAEVPTDLFLSDTSSGISALLYGCVDPCNRPSEQSTSLLVVHNPKATTPILRGFFPNAREYWMENDQLHCTSSQESDA